MRRYSCKVDEIGRVVIPAEVRRKLGITAGSELVLQEGSAEITLTTKQALRRQAQARVSALAPRSVSFSEELIADRRKEAQRERGKRVR